MNDYHKILINVREWADIVDAQKTFVPKIVMEIGSLNGLDAKVLSARYVTGEVYILEAHPIFSARIKAKYPDLHVWNLAGSDVDGEIDFNGVENEPRRIGASSVRERPGMMYKKFRVTAKRLDTFMSEVGLKEIDLLKIDVEGYSYEVLNGFGSRLKDAKSIHIENEHMPVWEGQKLYSDSEKILVDAGFYLASIKSAWPQSDSVWVRRDLFNPNWWK